VEQNVNLEKKANQREQLSLAYYSICIVQHALLDIAVNTVLLSISRKKDQTTAADLHQHVTTISHIGHNEYNEGEHQPVAQLIEEKLIILDSFKEISYNIASGEIKVLKENGAFLLNYFNRLGHYISDTYLIVLFALQAICETSKVIQESKLVNELHTTIIQLHNHNVIKELPSCLKELIETALRRFAAIELAVINTYTTSNGASISFVSCPFSKLSQLEELKIKIN
jgi:hypothetical protein